MIEALFSRLERAPSKKLIITPLLLTSAGTSPPGGFVHKSAFSESRVCDMIPAKSLELDKDGK